MKSLLEKCRLAVPVSFVSALMVMAGVAGAAPAAAPAAEEPPFKVTTSPQPVPNGLPVMRAFVFTETNRFSFILPPGMHLQTEVERRKLFLISNEGCALSMQASSPGSHAPLKTEGLAEQVVARFPGGKLVAESSVSAGGDAGPAYDVLWRTTTGQMQTRVGFVPVPGGCLEFNFTSPADKFGMNQLLFNRFLLSFRRSGPEGEIKVAKVAPPE